MSTSIINSNGLTELAKKIKNPASYLDVPTGEILWLSAKGCTTESIAEEGGVIDISGCGNHGRAYNSTSVVVDENEPAFYFYRANHSVIELSTPYLGGFIANSFTICARTKKKSRDSEYGHRMGGLGYVHNGHAYGGGFLFKNDGTVSFTDRLSSTDNAKTITAQNVPVDTKISLVATVNYTNGVANLYINGLLMNSSNSWFTGTKSTEGLYINLGSLLTHEYILADYFYDGYIYDFRIYPYALTPTQVKTLYMLQEQPLARVHSRNIVEPTDMTSSEIETMTSEIFTGE